jgi:hypothetical protein
MYARACQFFEVRKSWMFPFLLACGARTDIWDIPATADGSSPPCHVLIFGGVDSNGHDLDDSWLWDGTNWRRVNPPRSPSRRDSVAMTETANGEAIIFGGQTANNVLSDAWAWNGATYEQIATVTPRAEASVAAWQGGALMFGGRGTDGSVLGDTWLWDGAHWVALAPKDSPSARRGHTMARANDQIILFGGLDAEGNYLGDTWTWDGVTWTQRSLGPDPAAYAAMAEVGGTVLLYGGNGAQVDVVWGETWAWDGKNWQRTQALSEGLSARARYSLTKCADRAVMFGGVVNGKILGDTWTWHANEWVEEHPMISPPARYGHGAASLP